MTTQEIIKRCDCLAIANIANDPRVRNALWLAARELERLLSGLDWWRQQGKSWQGLEDEIERMRSDGGH